MKEHPDIVEFCHFPAYVRTRTAKPPVNKKRTRTLSHRESGSYDLGRHSYGSWNRGLSDSPTGLIAYSADLRRQSRPVRVLHRPPQKSSDICLRIFVVEHCSQQANPKTLYRSVNPKERFYSRSGFSGGRCLFQTIVLSSDSFHKDTVFFGSIVIIHTEAFAG